VWDRWRLPVHRIVIVNLKHDPSALRGVLWSVWGGWLTLKNAELLTSGAPTRIDGEVLVHRDHIAFLQVPPAAE
jgi:hypothetical protein